MESPEKLRATIRELQAINEQLRESNAELFRSIESLHRDNEELQVTNAAHEQQIHELTGLNDDMDNLLTSTQVHTLFLDRQMRIRRFTPGIAQTFSLIPQDVGRRFDTFSHQIIYDGLIDEVERVLRSAESFESEVVDKRGTWFLLRIRPYIARDQVEGALVTLVDTTTLKLAQTQLKEMSEIVEHSDDAIYRVDLDGTIRTWNLGASRLYGYKSMDVIGKHISLLSAPGRPSEAATFLKRVRSGVSLDHIETVRLRRNGTTVEVSLTVSPIRDHLGHIVAASVIARDITKQRQAEAEIRESVRQRDRFLATLSHELRNPLAAVLNATSVLREDNLDPEVIREAREVVDHQLRHVGRLLDDLLEVARFTNGKLILKSEVIDLNGLVAKVADGVRFQLDGKKQELHVTALDEPVFVNGDTGRLFQAQTNLLINASKYSPEGASIWFSLSRENGDAVVTVRDEGQGISSKLLPDVFEPFVQADQTIERSQGGMGLGLPLVKMIAGEHGGSVYAHSDGPEQGAKFTLRIPLTDAIPAKEDKSESRRATGGRLLLIEDNDGIRRMLARSLQLKGFEVADAADAKQGIERLDEFRPDVAIVDIGLPDIDGYEVARRIRSDARKHQPVLFAVTGYGREEDRAKAIEAGFDVHLVKPIDPDELVVEISKHVVPQHA